ncbi:YopX family protein [Streptococcus suis]|uniref:YopX family protein n=1 Tax=Streptococcus suis TaxID=1307 RepID=UPI000942818E|nr:YopX family protein [Streptococcus suis]MDW8671948.1 YopX family protein [Streptococcus suis]
MIPKFRAWDKISHAWRHDVYIGLDGLAKDLSRTGEEPFELPLDNVVIMQSTGLFDKNGKEIFEGDVVLENGWRKVAVSFGTQEIEENFGDKRIFQGFNLCLGGGYPDAVMSDFEVIGNIYKNPELVEGNND